MIATNVFAFPHCQAELPVSDIQEARNIGFTHYRRTEGDLIGKIAILRAAALISCDLALSDPDPQAGLDAVMRDFREEVAGLIKDLQD